MAKSWGHEQQRLEDVGHDDSRGFWRNHYEKRDDGTFGFGIDAKLDAMCASPKCREPATHMSRYSYVTGRAGRVSRREVLHCDCHAEKFRAKHDITVTDRESVSAT